MFALVHHSALTIHKAIGDTFDVMGTRILSPADLADSAYHVWEKAMLVVLLSCTRQLNGIYFRNTREEVRRCLELLMRQRSAWLEHCIEKVRRLDCTSTRAGVTSARVPVVDYSHYPFIRKTIDIPNDNVGYTYALGSTRDPSEFYIGSTARLRDRLAEHNSGRGPSFTSESICGRSI